MSDTHPAIRAWRETLGTVGWTALRVQNAGDALAAALEAEVKARREAEAALTDLEALASNLNTYAHHDKGCRGARVDDRCTCGLQAVRDALERR